MVMCTVSGPGMPATSARWRTPAPARLLWGCGRLAAAEGFRLDTRPGAAWLLGT